MQLEIVETQGANTLELCGFNSNWWSTHVERGCSIDLEPGDKLSLKVGSMSLSCEDGSGVVLTAPATLENTGVGDAWSVWKLVNGMTQYLKGSGAVRFLSSIEVGDLRPWEGPLLIALRRYLKDRAMGASATRVIYANNRDQADHGGMGRAPNQTAQPVR